jgi:hypothetical protein
MAFLCSQTSSVVHKIILSKKIKFEEDFAHCVDIAVPPRGLGWRLAAMYDFHARHRISPKRGHGQRGAIRWCFADRALADAFAQEFARDQKSSP